MCDKKELDKKQLDKVNGGLDYDPLNNKQIEDEGTPSIENNDPFWIKPGQEKENK